MRRQLWSFCNAQAEDKGYASCILLLEGWLGYFGDRSDDESSSHGEHGDEEEGGGEGEDDD